jgi:hypothetical protein
MHGHQFIVARFRQCPTLFCGLSLAAILMLCCMIRSIVHPLVVTVGIWLVRSAILDSVVCRQHINDIILYISTLSPIFVARDLVTLKIISDFDSLTFGSESCTTM